MSKYMSITYSPHGIHMIYESIYEYSIEGGMKD